MAKSKLTLKWSFGNEKLAKLDTVSFNLPAFKSADGFAVCPKAGACASYCYARQGRYIMPTVRAAREYNLAIVRESVERFEALALADLAGIKNSTVRVHDSGDFFSQDYLDSWFRIARAYPSKRFYAYTKSLHLDYSDQPENFNVVQSVGGLLDSAIDTTRPHARVFEDDAQRIGADYVDGNLNDGPAIDGTIRIGLVYHGTKNLKDGQRRYLRMVKVGV